MVTYVQFSFLIISANQLTMLSFEEFKAANNRDKNKLRQGTPIDTKTNTQSKTPKNENNQEKKTTLDFGSFLEMTQLQIFIIVLILLDTFSSFLETYMLLISHQSAAGAGTKDQEYFVNSIYFRISFMMFNGFTGFSLYLFALEILAIIIVFRSAMIFHLGYMLDSITIAIQLYAEILHIGKVARILNFLRLWRIIRLINKLVEQEKQSTQNAIEQNEKQLIEYTQLQIEYKQIQNNIIKEKAAKTAIEEMLKGYKDEVDTLNEALKIAAMDIAEIGGGTGFDDFDSDSDGEVSELEDTTNATDTKDISQLSLSIPTNKIKAQNSQQQQSDSNIIESKNQDMDSLVSKSVDSSNKILLAPLRVNKGQTPVRTNFNADSNADVTFVINEDGSYLKKK